MYEQLKQLIYAIVQANPTLKLSNIRREIDNIWFSINPADRPKPNMFRTFVRNNMKRVRSENPTLSHGDHMKLLGTVWKDIKKTAKNKNA